MVLRQFVVFANQLPPTFQPVLHGFAELKFSAKRLKRFSFRGIFPIHTAFQLLRNAMGEHRRHQIMDIVKFFCREFLHRG